MGFVNEVNILPDNKKFYEKRFYHILWFWLRIIIYLRAMTKS